MKRTRSAAGVPRSELPNLSRHGHALHSALVAIALLSFDVPDAQAATYTVNTSSDSVVANACENHLSGCSLRGAILAANAHSGDTINFSIIEFCGLNGCFINLLSALPDISAPMSILGPTRHVIQRSSSAATSFRIFNVTTTGTVNISDLTIKQGLASNANGGGLQISSAGTVNVINCVFQGNAAGGKGGAIHNSNDGMVNVTNCTFVSNGGSKGGAISSSGGTLTATNCTFTGNVSNLSGGAIHNIFGTVNVISSTFNANIADDNTIDGGGAICTGDNNGFDFGILNVTSSTFVANFAFKGGAIESVAQSITTVTNSTFSANRVMRNDSGGGIASDSTGPVNVKSCIIARSTAEPNFTTPRSDVSGVFSSGGFNLIGKSDNSTGFTQSTDQVGTIVAPLDAKFDPAGLQNNGGPTQTIALQPASPALDKGTSSGLTGNLTTDQRGSGFPRIADYSNVANAVGGDGADIGAFEGTRLQITSITRLGSGAIRLRGLGSPGAVPKIEVSDIPNAAGFGFLANITADGTGALVHDDATSLLKRFYRLRFP